MIRQVIEINENLCDGCGICVEACHEGAIGLKDGKAVLLRDDYCDGLGDCLPTCPTGAISFVEREALPFDEEAVKAHMEKREEENNNKPKFSGCPGSMQRELKPNINQNVTKSATSTSSQISELRSWPLQIKLVNPMAEFLNNSHLLIAADCTAFAYGNFHQDFIKGKIAIIGCPKLDQVEYSEKIRTILEVNNIKSVTVVKMEVPCCQGLANATIDALKNCDKMISWNIKTISLDGNILED
ncbi:MAG: ATP-binding protein [Lachnospirales bacterium]